MSIVTQHASPVKKSLVPVATVEFTAASYDPERLLADRYDYTPVALRLGSRATAAMREDNPRTVGEVGAWMDLWGLRVMTVAQPSQRAPGSRWVAVHKLTLGLAL